MYLLFNDTSLDSNCCRFTRWWYCDSNVVLHIGPDDVFGAFDDACSFVQEGSLGFSVRKDCDTSHDGLHGVSIHHTFLAAGNEEGGFATSEVIIEIDQEGEERGLTSVWWGRVVLVCVGHRIDAGWWPCAICALKKSALVRAELWIGTHRYDICTLHQVRIDTHEIFY